jgi:hypothetical protein
MFTYKILDGAVTDREADAIEQYCTSELLWGYSKNISGISPEHVKTPKWINMATVQNGFASKIFESDNEEIEEYTAFELVYPLIHGVRELFPFDISLVRVRAGMFMPTSRGGAHIPHVDYYFPHYTLLYYVNDSDGDTILWQEKASKDDPEAYPESFNILERLTPKKGRAVLFNGMHYHSSSLPKKSTERIAINFNFLTEWF